VLPGSIGPSFVAGFVSPGIVLKRQASFSGIYIESRDESANSEFSTSGPMMTLSFKTRERIKGITSSGLAPSTAMFQKNLAGSCIQCQQSRIECCQE